MIIQKNKEYFILLEYTFNFFPLQRIYPFEEEIQRYKLFLIYLQWPLPERDFSEKLINLIKTLSLKY